MFIYLLYFTFIIFASLVLRQNTRHQMLKSKGNVTYLFWCVFLMFLMIGLRDINTGVDTRSYINNFRTYTLLNLMNSKEPLYVLWVCAIKNITDSYKVFLCSMAVVYCLAIYKVMRKYLRHSSEILISFIVLFIFQIYAFSVAAMRQTFALGFVMFAFLEADKGKWKRFLLWIILGAGFHNSAILGLVLFPLRNLNLGKYGILIAFALFGLSLVLPRDFMMQIQQYIGFESDLRYFKYGSSYESELSLSGFIMQMIPLILIYIRRDHIQLEKHTKNLFLNCAYIGAGLQSMVVVVAEFYRVSFYFAIFDIVLIPLAFSTLPKNISGIAKAAFVLIGLIYLFFIGQGALPLPDASTSNYN